MLRTRTLFLSSALALAAAGCSPDAVVMVYNDTTCSFEDVEGIKVHPKTGDEVTVFAFERIDPRDERPAFFRLDWEGTLRIKATQPEGFEADYEIKPGVKNLELRLTTNGPVKCRLRSAEEF